MRHRGLKADPIVEARARHRLPPSRVSPFVTGLGRFLIPAYLRLVLRIDGLDIRDPDRILQPLRDFQEGRIRLVVAFRHPYGDESQILFHAFENRLPRLARRLGRPLARRPGLRFVHGHEVALWGDPFIRWMLPRIGAVPVHHRKSDPGGLGAIRSILLDDPRPLALAPEGQVSYRSETVPRLEQGAARLGFWCARDLEKAGRTERVHILPISVHYRHETNTRMAGDMLHRLEVLCGLVPSSADRPGEEPASAPHAGPGSAPSQAWRLAMRHRLAILETRLLDLAEAYYFGTGDSRDTDPGPDGPAHRQERWDALMDAALATAEQALGIKGRVLRRSSPNGPGEERIQRVYRIRETCWDRLYPEVPPDGQPALAAALLHRQAGEAWYAMRHMEFVDLAFYLDTAYLEASSENGPTFDRIVETLVNLDDLASRLMGGNISNRANPMRKRVILQPGPSLDLADRMEDFRHNPKGAVLAVTEALNQAFLDCIREVLDE